MRALFESIIDENSRPDYCELWHDCIDEARGKSEWPETDARFWKLVLLIFKEKACLTEDAMIGANNTLSTMFASPSDMPRSFFGLTMRGKKVPSKKGYSKMVPGFSKLIESYLREKK